jgi:hypothetical protein
MVSGADCCGMEWQVRNVGQRRERRCHVRSGRCCVAGVDWDWCVEARRGMAGELRRKRSGSSGKVWIDMARSGNE